MSKTQMNVKVEKRDLNLIHKISSMRGEGEADFVRRAIRRELGRYGFLKKEEMKALELDDN